MDNSSATPAASAATAEASRSAEGFDTGSHESFYEYYKRQSLSPATMQRFSAMAEVVMRMRRDAAGGPALAVLDIGCGAGAQCRFWAERGVRYCGIDINEPLVRLARERAAEQQLNASFEVGSATALPFADASFDICLMPELLEHIADWRTCLNEAVRVLKPGGTLYISTSNRLCPKQQEFNLPAYSWYPPPLKRSFERRAVTDWPAVANYAKYPAVNWFSFYQLRSVLTPAGFQCLDRFDIMNLGGKPGWAKALVGLLRALPPLRLLGHMATPDTVVLAHRARA